MRERGRKCVDFDGWGSGEDLGRVWGGKPIITIYCMKKIYFIFFKKDFKKRINSDLN